MRNKALVFIVLTLMLLGMAGCTQGNHKTNDNDQGQSENLTRKTSETSEQDTKLDAQKQGSQLSDKTTKTETELVSVETPILDKKKNRLQNINLAVEALNGKVINPGEEFSFNSTVGRRTLERGFKKAIIFVDKEKEMEVGGGICQLSSNIYAAAKKAGLQVTERHAHQLPVDYIDANNDATVFYGQLDMKFINNTDAPVRIDFHVGANSITTTITKIKEQTKNAL